MMVYASNVGSTAGSTLLTTDVDVLKHRYDIDGHVHKAGDSIAPENQNRAAKAGTGSRRLTGTCIAKKQQCHFRFRILRRFEHNTSPPYHPYPSWTSNDFNLGCVFCGISCWHCIQLCNVVHKGGGMLSQLMCGLPMAMNRLIWHPFSMLQPFVQSRIFVQEWEPWTCL